MPSFGCAGQFDFRIGIQHSGSFFNGAEIGGMTTSVNTTVSNNDGSFSDHEEYPYNLINHPNGETTNDLNPHMIDLRGSFSVVRGGRYFILITEKIRMFVEDGIVQFTGPFRHPKYNGNNTFSEWNSNAKIHYNFFPSETGFHWSDIIYQNTDMTQRELTVADYLRNEIRHEIINRT